jgi:hypothetical protein
MPEAGEAELQDTVSRRKLGLAFLARIEETEVLTHSVSGLLAGVPRSASAGLSAFWGSGFSTPLATRRHSGIVSLSQTTACG